MCPMDQLASSEMYHYTPTYPFALLSCMGAFAQVLQSRRPAFPPREGLACETTSTGMILLGLFYANQFI